MLEYFHDTTLQLLPENILRRWLGVPRPYDYLTLLRTAKLLSYCSTAITRPCITDFNYRTKLNVEFGLPPSTTMLQLRNHLQAYLDEPWRLRSCTYRYNAKLFTVNGELTARRLWQHLNRHGLFLLVTVNPSSLQLDCRHRYESFHV